MVSKISNPVASKPRTTDTSKSDAGKTDNAKSVEKSAVDKTAATQPAAEKTVQEAQETTSASAQTVNETRRRVASEGALTAAQLQNQVFGTADAAPTTAPAAPADKAAVAERSQQNVYTDANPATMEAIKAGETGELTRGFRGPGVQETQAALNKFGFGLAEDSRLGPRTESAIKSFQEAKGLPVTGEVNAATFAALQSTDPASIQDKLKTELPPRFGTTTPSGPHEGTNGTATFDNVRGAGQRNQMVQGQITVNGNTYDFNSGGGGRGNLPPGEYQVARHLQNRGDRSMSVDGVGYSFAMSDKYDARVGGTRSLLRIHPDGGGAGTIGCIGIVGNGATQRQFRADMNAEIERNGGSYTLNVG